VIADCLLMIRMIIWKLPEFDDKMLIRDKRLVTYHSFTPPLTIT